MTKNRGFGYFIGQSRCFADIAVVFVRSGGFCIPLTKPKSAMNLFNDQEQFGLFKEGNKEAYAYFFKRHHEGIYNYIRNMAADAEMAKDLSQDVFKRLWDLRGNIQSAQHLAAYIYVMARHLFLEHLRKLKVMSNAARELAYTIDMRETLNNELEIVCYRVLAEMKAAMQRLSTKRKLVLRLLYINGLDINAIALQLKLSPQTVRNHKAQATAILRERLVDRDLVMPLSLSILLRYIEEQ
jgi:RNA polymerase sigma factor (sigma-70 family)